MADDQIKPALTAEEWAEWGHIEGGWLVVGARSRQACAALALNGQPFGFTRAHIKALMDCVDFTGGPEADKAEELAHILTALLPPE